MIHDFRDVAQHYRKQYPFVGRVIVLHEIDVGKQDLKPLQKKAAFAREL
jgi:hypothetical protein